MVSRVGARMSPDLALALALADAADAISLESLSRERSPASRRSPT